MNIRLPTLALLGIINLIGSPIAGAAQLEHAGFWGGLDIGAGFLERSNGGFDDSSTDIYLGGKFGYTITPQFLAALELSGWNQEATEDVRFDPDADPTKGEGLMQVFLISRLYPMKNSGLFTKVGGGWLRQWNNDPASAGALDGWGVVVGAGYDFAFSKKYAVTPFVNFSYGEANTQEHRAITVGVGFTMQ
jgi:hypothetical protein